MKFFSILRLPRHQKYHYKPRYYDEVKEDIAERTSRIKMELKHQRQKERLNLSDEERSEEAIHYSRISHHYTQERAHTTSRSANLTQFIIMILLVLTVVGYLEFGNVALYPILLIAPIYMFIRIKKKR